LPVVAVFEVLPEGVQTPVVAFPVRASRTTLHGPHHRKGASIMAFDRAKELAGKTVKFY
jgi:hypothetical protein